LNFVVITAALSSMNTNIYLCSRMLFSLSRGGFLPSRLARLGSRDTPILAILTSGVVILCAAGLARLTPHAFVYLFDIALFGMVIVWLAVLFSHLSFRRVHRGKPLPLRLPLFPWIQIAAIVLLLGVLITMGLDEQWSASLMVGIPWLLLLSVIFVIHRLRSAKTAPAAKNGVGLGVIGGDE
jgi:L-asparagine transporter-like permease